MSWSWVLLAVAVIAAVLAVFLYWGHRVAAKKRAAGQYVLEDEPVREHTATVVDKNMVQTPPGRRYTGWSTPGKLFYNVIFRADNGTETEYSVPEEMYHALWVGQRDVLTTHNGQFLDFAEYMYQYGGGADDVPEEAIQNDGEPGGQLPPPGPVDAAYILSTLSYCGLPCGLCREGPGCKSATGCGKRAGKYGCYQYTCCHLDHELDACHQCADAPCGQEEFAPGKIKQRAFVRCQQEDGPEAFAGYLVENEKRNIAYRRGPGWGDYDLDDEEAVLRLLRTGFM